MQGKSAVPMVCQYAFNDPQDESQSKGDGCMRLDCRFAACDPTSDYVPRNPADSVLYKVVAENLETFLARQGQRERIVPRFVERELRKFLDCGILAHGFLRMHCDACGRDRLVAYSCKGRGLCSSCCGRRMADTAAHLVDRVLPRVPIRQWVLSFPMPLRYRLAYDSRLVRDVLHIFIRAVFASLRRRARACGIRDVQCGAVTFVQRFGGAINLNIHFHSLVLEGVYYQDDGQKIRFKRLPPPCNAEVARVTVCIARRITRLLERRGLGPAADPEEADPLLRDQPLLAELYAASLQGRITVGPRAGNLLTAFGADTEDVSAAVPSGPRCAAVSGFSLHANVCIPAKARRQLENLCRYAARPAVATERLSVLPDGRLLYRLRHRWRNGATHVVFEPLEFVAKLAALVPAPMSNLVRYHGLLSPAARWRSAIVPSTPEAEAEHHDGCSAGKQPDRSEKSKPGCSHPRNYSWAELMKRVWELDVLKCDRCGGRMRILAAIHSPDAIRGILECLGLPTRTPPICPVLEQEFLK
jgi:hypothetical protein